MIFFPEILTTFSRDSYQESREKALTISGKSDNNLGKTLFYTHANHAVLITLFCLNKNIFLFKQEHFSLFMEPRTLWNNVESVRSRHIMM